MARKPASEPPAEEDWTPDSIRAAVRKLRRGLADVEGFDPRKITRQFDPEVISLEISIREMLNDVFGANTRSYRNYQSAASLDMAGININGTPLHRVIEGLVQGKERSITLIKGAIRFFERKMEDDFPGEPFDRVGSTGNTEFAIGRPDLTVNSGAQGTGVAGDIGASIQNDVPTGGVIIADSPDTLYTELQARVALLESSVSQLRSELDSPARTKEVGIGHNRGPEFDLASAEELDDVAGLIALLREQGPNPPADSTDLVERNKRVTLVAEKINQGLFALGIEMSKGAAREAGKGILVPLWTAVSHWITSVGHALITWLGS